MYKKYLISSIIILALLFIAVAHYGDRSAVETKSDKLQITASFYPLYFFASEIGGDMVHVTNITHAGVEPHDYEPGAQDIASLERSALIILNGGGLEPWSKTLSQNISHERTKITVVGDGLLVDHDPHIWLSPVIAKKMADKIALELSDVDQANAYYYSLNVAAFKTRLDALDSDFRSGLGSCQKHEIITSHAAFGYLAREYGLKQVSIAGLSPESEPSLSRLVEIAKFAKDNDVKYIFFESLVSPRLSDTIANEIGAKTLVLNPIEGMSPDDMVVGKNYFTEMQTNLDNLKIALQCN